ncbi:MAG: glutathione S-transferase family protein [Granulosicoccus sp.]|nr:glutathione S-transferase family protein [Granulosicoccus sp.]
MKLFGHPESGHAFKVRFFLTAHNIEHEYERVDIFSSRSERQKEFVENARYGEVPLLLHDNEALVQSNSILLYVADRWQLGLSQKTSLRQQTVEWLMWEANKIGMCLPQLRSFLRYEMNEMQGAAKPWLLDRYHHDVGIIEHVLSDGRQWIVDDAVPSIADFSLCGYLVFADQANVPVPPYTTRWLQRLYELPGYQPPDQLL